MMKVALLVQGSWDPLPIIYPREAQVDVTVHDYGVGQAAKAAAALSVWLFQTA